MEITINKALQKIKESHNIVISPHVNPDCDGLGSSLALYYALKKQGHKVRVFVDDDIPEAYHILPGWELFERPDKKINADLLIILDAEPERTGRIREMADAPILNFDHHRSNTKTADFLYLKPEKAATGEIIFDLLQVMGVELEYNIAMPLYTAIATDCGFFRYSNTQPSTMRAAAELLQHGVRPNDISEALDARDFSEVKAMADVIHTTELFNGGTVAAAYADEKIMEKCHTTEGFVDEVRIIRNVDVAVFLKYVEDNLTRVSMRSKKTDVASVAETLGGGGHVHAAGCSLKMPVFEAKKKVVTAVLERMAKQNG